MSVVQLAILIVASFAGGGAYWGTARAGAGAWLSFTLGVLVALVIWVLAPHAVFR